MFIKLLAFRFSAENVECRPHGRSVRHACAGAHKCLLLKISVQWNVSLSLMAIGNISVRRMRTISFFETLLQVLTPLFFLNENWQTLPNSQLTCHSPHGGPISVQLSSWNIVTQLFLFHTMMPLILCETLLSDKDAARNTATTLLGYYTFCCLCDAYRAAQSGEPKPNVLININPLLKKKKKSWCCSARRWICTQKSV